MGTGAAVVSSTQLNYVEKTPWRSRSAAKMRRKRDEMRKDRRGE